MLKRFVKNNFNYYLSRNEYYDSVATENGFLNRIASNLFIKSNNVLTTQNRILFNNKIQINATESEVIDQLGKYNFYLEKSKSQKHAILFYKKLIGALRARFELHFVEGELIIAFTTFDVSSTSNKLKVLKALTEKYEVTMQDTNLDNFRIEDAYGNYIQIIDSVNITLAYGHNSKENNQLINNLANEKEFVRQSLIDRENKHLKHNL